MYPFLIFMMGFSFLMSISTLFKSALNDWERANLYCALMFACCFINCLCIVIDFDLAHYGFHSQNFENESTPGLWFNHLTPTFLLFLYRDFLNTSIESPRFYQFMTWALRIILVCIFVEIILTFFPTYSWFYNVSVKIFQSILLIIFLILPFYALRFWRHPIFRYAAWSSWNIIILYGGFLFLTETGLDKYLPHWFINNMLFFIILVDGIFFLFALTVRDRQLVIEKTQLQQQATISELKALRTQMNPHFIFNCLNAIKSYTLNHDTEGADFYLTKFSKLIRQVLENSRSEKITLHNELETLKLYLDMEKPLLCEALLLATGGCRAAVGGQLAVALGHTLEPPVPSLFTFHIEVPWVRALAGLAVERVEVSVPGTGLREAGPVLLTHWGVSGPAILRLSAWGARVLAELNYKFPLLLNWLPHLNAETVAAELQARRASQPARLVVNSPIAPLPARLWEQLVLAAGITRDTRWSVLSKAQFHQLTQQLTRTELPVSGKSLNKDEFVTCGGVRLHEVNLKTMESRVCRGLYFAGEVLDIDGITGGFNFQAAWTTGWIAGNAMAGSATGESESPRMRAK